MALSDRDLRRFLEAIPDAALAVAADGTVVHANARAERLFGCPSGGLAGRSHDVLVPEDRRASHRLGFASFFARPDAHPMADGREVTALRADGSAFPAECFLSPLETSGGVQALAVMRDLTERRRVERELCDREARYRQLFEANPHPMWVYDLETMAFLAVNDAAVQKYGYARQEFLAMTIADIRPPEDLERLRENVARVTVGLDEAGRWRHRRKDDTVLDVEIVSHTLDWDGRRAELVLAHDVTERRQAEEELRRRTRGLAALLEVSQALAETLEIERVLQASVEGATRLFSAGTAAVYLLEGEVVRLRATTPPLPADIPEALTRALLSDHPHLQDVLASGRPSVLPDAAVAELTPAERAIVEMRDLRSILYVPLVAGVESVGALIVASTGAPRAISPTEVNLCRTLANLAALAVTNARLYEVAQRHAAELEREVAERVRAEGELRQRQEQMAKIVATSPGVVCSFRLRPDGSVSFPFAAPGMEAFFGVAPEQLADDASVIFTRIHSDDVALVREAIAASARALGSWRAEFRVDNPSRGQLWLEGHAIPVREPDGGVLWHGIVLDVTERKRAETEKEALQIQLAHAQKMEAIGRLAGGVAHDFNNMLGVILGRAELALAKAPPEGPVRGDLAEIIQAAERSSVLTRQLLAFARRQTVSPQVLDLNTAVGRTLQMLRRLIGEDIDLAWVPGAEVWPVRLDPSQLDQILANLVVNARDAIPQTGRIALETRNEVVAQARDGHGEVFAPGEYVCLTVSDDGCGMDEEILNHLFEPFFTTKGPGQGTGLGLATVYGVVRQNGGFVDVRSRSGAGTTFRVHLPRARLDAARAAGGPEDTAAPEGDETILLVEDEAAILALTREMLEGLGYTVLAAGSPGEALRLAEGHAGEIHLLVTDVVMPGMNGRELAEQLTSARPGLACLFISGYSADVVAHRGVLEEGVRLVGKPFTVRELAAEVREALARRLNARGRNGR